MSDSSEWHAKACKEMREAAQARQLNRLLDENVKALHVNNRLLSNRDDLAAQNERLKENAIEREKIQAARYEEHRDAIEKLIDIIMRANRIKRPFALTAEELNIVLKAHRLANPADPDFDPTEE